MCKQTLGPVQSLGAIATSAPASVKAELDLDTPSAALDTIVRAKVAGDAGNDITVSAVGDSPAAGGVTIEEDLDAKTVIIHFEDAVSTVLQVETAIGTDSDLIEVKTAGTPATVLTTADDFAATNLAGGSDPGVALADAHFGAMRPSEYLVTAVVTSAPSDLFMWGAVMSGSEVATPADDIWGLHSNVYGTQAQGKIGTALAVGTHHLVVKDVGIYTRLFFTRSAGAVDVSVRPIYYSDRGS